MKIKNLKIKVACLSLTGAVIVAEVIAFNSTIKLQSTETNLSSNLEKKIEVLKSYLERKTTLTEIDKYIYKIPLGYETQEIEEILKVYPTDKLTQKYYNTVLKISYSCFEGEDNSYYEDLIRENPTVNNLYNLFIQAKEKMDDESIQAYHESAVKMIKEGEKKDFLLSFPIIVASETLFEDSNYKLTEEELSELKEAKIINIAEKDLTEKSEENYSKIEKRRIMN